MQSKKDKKTGLVILILGVVCSLSLYIHFDLSGGIIDYKDLSSLLKLFFAVAFLPVALYFGLYFISGKKLAIQLGGG